MLGISMCELKKKQYVLVSAEGDRGKRRDAPWDLNAHVRFVTVP